MASIVWLAPLRCTPVAEEPLGLGEGTQAKIFELSDTRAANPFGDIAGEVEHGVSISLRRREKACIAGIRRDEALDKFGPDLVVRLPDGWAECSHDTTAPGAEPLNCGNGRLDHARERPAPAGMRRADHACLTVGEQ